MRAAPVTLLLAACLALGVGVANADTDARLELEPVIEISSAAGRTLLQDGSSPGGYGYGYGYGGRRRLTQASGGEGAAGGYGYGYGYGYGGRRRLAQAAGDSSAGGYGYGVSGHQGRLHGDDSATSSYGYGGRRLSEVQLEPQFQVEPGLEDQPADAAAAPQSHSQLQEQELREQLVMMGQQEQQPAFAGSKGEQPAAAAAAAAGLRSVRAAAAAVGKLSVPPGQCYCRYDHDYNTWALAEEPCRAALAAKCGAGQLPCSWLEAYYTVRGGGGMAHTLPHEQDILGFVFDDCQPHPPCACAGVKFDGKDPVADTYACCRDLHAACRTPFDGLSCSDVDAFCKDDAPSPKLAHWAANKLHRGAECAEYKGTPYDFVPFGSAMTSKHEEPPRGAGAAAEESGAGDGAVAAGLALRAAASEGGAADASFGPGRVAAAVACLGGLLVGVAILGMIATLTHSGGGGGAGAAYGPAPAAGDAGCREPLLRSAAELSSLSEHGEALGDALHMVRSDSSNDHLGSLPASSSAGDASLEAARFPGQ